MLQFLINRLSSTIMGEASPPKGEFILVALPFTKDFQIDAILKGIQERHPNVEIEYHDIQFAPTWQMGNNSISEGIPKPPSRLQM
jgi:hypothetical protein